MVKGAYYTCNQAGHISRDCPTRRQASGPTVTRPPRRTTAAVNDWTDEAEAGQDEENVAAIQLVSVTFHVNRDKRESNFFKRIA